MSEWQPALLRHPSLFCTLHEHLGIDPIFLKRAGKTVRVRVAEFQKINNYDGSIIPRGECLILEVNPEDAIRFQRPDWKGYGVPCIFSCQVDTD